MTTILVVDDSKIDRKVAGGFVAEAGHTPRFAESGRAALQCVEEDGIDIVVTDLRMPDLDGLALVREMRKKHPSVPVILMTAHGSEETAVAALHAGAAHYVPKTNLRRDLAQAISVVLDAMTTAREMDRVREYLHSHESHYVLGYEKGGPRALVGHLQECLLQMQLCEKSDLIRVGTALTEALSNALDHGNLELDSALREEADGAYWRVGEERAQVQPYRDRRVHVTVRFTKTRATFVVRDEGPGFDYTQLPDPTDPENLLKASGRGVLLIRTFMDDVEFNEKGNQITMVMTREPSAC